MSQTTTDKTINVAQLNFELGSVGVRAVGPNADGVLVLKADCDLSVLEAAIEAHVADPGWVDPEYVEPDPPRDYAAEIDDLKEKHAQQLADRDAVDDELMDWNLDLELRLMDLEA